MEESTQVSKPVNESKSVNSAKAMDKKGIARLCSSRRKNPSLNWAAHIYQVLDELCPYLLLREPVIEAFHTFIRSLQKYQSEHHTYYFTARNKYSSGIITLTLITNGLNNGRVNGMPSRFLIRNMTRENEIAIDIYQHYLPLYELIKDDIVPAFEQKKRELRKQMHQTRLHREMGHVNQLIIKLKERYERTLENLNRTIVHINHEIVQLDAT
jgi:hypothetical protein